MSIDVRRALADSRSRVAIISGFGLLLLAAISAVVLTVSAGRAEQATRRSMEVRQALTELFSTVQDAETGQRGYLLTNNASYLEPYERARIRIPTLAAQLQTQVADDPAQVQRVQSLSLLLAAKLKELEETISTQRQGDAENVRALLSTDLGQSIMREIRQVSAQIDQAEAARLEDRRQVARDQRSLLVAVIVLAVLAAGVLAILIGQAERRYRETLGEQNRALANEMHERERAETMLRQAQKMEALGQLTGGVAHDFNNMLAIIVGNLDILLRRLPAEDTRLRSLAENSLAGANRAAALTQRLLAFSRLQPLDPKPTDVNKCIAEMSEMLRRALGEHIGVETVLGGGLWRAFVDAPQLESAILNLAVNARDAMAEGGRLTIETSNAALDQAYAAEHIDVEPGQYVLVAITDTGSGMPPGVIEKAFDPFFTTKQVGQGTGLGLSQVHGFLKQSRGHVKIYSEVGVGTTVKLYLPRDVSKGAVQAPIRGGESGPIAEGHVVLVVEDDPGVRTFVVSAAREIGFVVHEADSAAVALERLAEHVDIKILLTDVVMPVTDGRRLVDAALKARPDLRVIYMTGYTRNAIVHNGMLDAGTRLLSKPFTLQQLERELRDVVASMSSAGG